MCLMLLLLVLHLDVLQIILGNSSLFFPPVDTECSVWIWTRSCQACQKRNDCFGNPFYMFYAVVMKLHDLDHTLD